MVGGGVVDAPAFKENLLAFGVSYGLALQGLGVSRIRTNLLPREIMQKRIIRAKKPWAAAAAALLLLGFTLSYFMTHRARESVALDPSSPLKWGSAMSQAQAAVSEQQQIVEAYNGEKSKFVKTMEVGESMLQNVATRDAWMHVLTAVNLCLPREPLRTPQPGTPPRTDDPAKTVDLVGMRNEIKIDALECRWTDNLSEWYTRTAEFREKPAAPAGATPPMDGSVPQEPPTDGSVPPEGAPPAAPVGPTGGGWVFRGKAHHYHNLGNDPSDKGIAYVTKTLIKNLEKIEIDLPAGAGTYFPVGKIGIGYPVVIGRALPRMDFQRPAREGEIVGGKVVVADPAGKIAEKVLQPRQDFEFQFCWQPQIYETYKNPHKKRVAPPPVVATAP